MEENEEVYSTIRQVLGNFIGQRIVEITQQDEDEFAEDGRSYVMLMFESGDYVKFFVGDDGFEYSEESAPEQPKPQSA